MLFKPRKGQVENREASRRRRVSFNLVFLSFFIVLLMVPSVFNSNSHDNIPCTNTIGESDKLVEAVPYKLSAVQYDIFPSGSYSYGNWSWVHQDPHGHVQDHGTEFSMGQDQYSPWLCIDQSEGLYTGWFYSGVANHSGPALTSLTSQINPRTQWTQNSGDDGNGYYQIDLHVQKYVASSWITMGTWDSAWTYTGKTTNPSLQSKTDWGPGVVNGSGSYRLAMFMVVDTPMSGCLDQFWLYIEDLALFGEDDAPPIWVDPPTDQVVEFGNGINYDLDATDSAGIDQWWINGTSPFEIDNSGVISNNTALSIGSFGIEVWVNDTQNNVQTAIFQVTVQDTTGPTWDQPLTNQEFALGLPFSYDVNASDLSGIDYYWVNDTTYFNIDGNGVISNYTTLVGTTYSLEIRSYDPYGNFIVTIIDIIAVNADPVWIEIPSHRFMEFGSQFQYNLNATAFFGIESYWLNDTTYFAINSNGLITNVSQVPVGVHSFEVRAFDPDSRNITAFFSIECQDTTAPVWIETPSDYVLEFGNSLFYRLNATDLSDFDNWWINDTLHFAIDNSGLLTNVGFSIGKFGIHAWVNDTHGNILTGNFSILVRDTTPPSWSVTPTDQTIFKDEALDYHLSATDISGISDFAINDTVHFTITSSGRMTSIGLPAAGHYGIIVTVYDNYGNSISTEFTITILPLTTAPSTTPTTLPDFLPGIFLVLAGVAVGIVTMVVVNIILKKGGE